MGPMAKTFQFVRAPFVLISLLIGLILLLLVLSIISFGEWVEIALKWAGYRGRPYWIPGVLGFVAYLGLGFIGPAYGGNALLGWPGLIAGPMIAVAIISWLGQW